MGQLAFTFMIFLLLEICYARHDDFYFSKIGSMKGSAKPFKLNDELQLLNHNSIFSTRDVYQTCRFPNTITLSHLSTFGNGKILTFGESIRHFNVIELKNCSFSVITFIPNIKNDDDLDVRYKLVMYNDTFDVFDFFQITCMPCRYNDKGERLHVEHLLEMEPRGESSSLPYSGYSLELIRDAFGIMKGYFYVLRYINGTSNLKILDSNFNVVKQRLFDANIEAHSVLHENLTICYKKDACKPDPAEYCIHWRTDKSLCDYTLLKILSPLSNKHTCQYVECHLLNSDLDTVAQVKLRQIINLWDIHTFVEMTVENLAGGGAMVAMDFKEHKAYGNDHRDDVFIQRIHPNGRVDPPIRFDSLENSSLDMYGFTFNNDEYCLITVNRHSREGSYTLVKCLNPSPANY